mmetsp:Transcript_48194/g.112766  ORF Transcript_48194/g.112766 Transcript_48194/m.112766 type:complete len:182 (-) Transcript_48194:78-623(-)
MVQVEETTYVMAPDGLLIDPGTQDAVGYLNRETKVVEPLSSRARVEVDVIAVEGCSQDAAEVNILSEAQTQLEKAQECVQRECWHTAAAAYSKALDACRESRAIDVEVECEMLRGRAQCWEKLQDYDKLLRDAELLLSLDDNAEDAKDWRARAELASSAGAACVEEDGAEQEVAVDVEELD